MVNFLFNLNIIFLHTFIKDLKFMLPSMDLIPNEELELDDELPFHVECVNKQDNVQNVDMDT